jgi:hypothetical protein
VQDKVWVTAPGQEQWEVYVVKGDAGTLERQEDSTCCVPAPGTAEAGQAAASTCC